MVNQCVSCGLEIPEGDHVCKECLKAAGIINTADEDIELIKKILKEDSHGDTISINVGRARSNSTK